MSENGDPGSATVNPRYIHLFVYMKTHYKMVDDKRGGKKDKHAEVKLASWASLQVSNSCICLFLFNLCYI